MQGPCNIAENVATQSEAIEDLRIVAVEVFGTKLERVLAEDLREIVFDVRMVKEFTLRPDRERMASRNGKKGQKPMPVPGTALELTADRGRFSCP